jgi:hypothetical protein
MVGAGAASRRAAPSQSLKLPAVCTAGSVYRASSPTMRRRTHRSSLQSPRRPKPPVCSTSSCEGGSWRVRRSLQTSNRSDDDGYAHACMKLLRSIHQRARSSCVRRRAQPAHSLNTAAGGRYQLPTRTHCYIVNESTLKDSSCSCVGAGQPAGWHRSPTERRGGC